LDDGLLRICRSGLLYLKGKDQGEVLEGKDAEKSTHFEKAALRGLKRKENY